MKISLRLLEKRDISACAAIVGMNYSKRYEKSSKKEIASMFSRSAITPVYWVAESEGIVVGFGAYIQSWMDYGVYQMFWINAHPQFKRQGIGRKVVGKLISEVRKRRGAHLIQISATRPNARYYRMHFKFKTLATINGTPEYLMGLRIR